MLNRFIRLHSGFPLLLLLVMLFARPVSAQLYNFKKYNTKNGLGNSSVNSIMQSANGYLWFGTQGGGLCRFDGKDFKTYTKIDGLINNDVTSIAEDKNNNLWIGTVDGLCLFDGVSFKKFQGREGVEHTVVYNLFVDSYGDIWIPTASLGLKIYRNGKFITVDTTNGLGSNFVFSVTQDKNDNFWVGTFRGGFYKLNREGKILQSFSELDGNNNTSVFCLHSKGDSVVYCGTNNSGIYKIVNGTIKKLNIPELEGQFIGSIISDGHGNTWAGSERGLIKFSTGGGYKIYREYDGLSSEVVNALREDYEGNIWIGTQGGGVCLLKREAIVTFTTRDGLSNNKVATVFRTRDGTLFASPQHGGLNYYDPISNRFQNQKQDEEFQNSSISSFCELPGNILVVGTEENGLVYFEQHGASLIMKKRISKFTVGADEVPINTVTSIVSDKMGHIWVSSYGHGLFKLDNQGNLVDHYNSTNGLSTDQIANICIDKSGRLIIAGFNNDVQVFKDGKFSMLSANAPQAMKTTWTSTMDKKGTIYFGTQDGGLVIYDKGKFTNYNVSHGLCSNFIEAIVINGEDIWLGTDKGVNKIKLGKDFTIEEIRYYGTEDGFISAEIFQNSMFGDKNGDVWFGTSEGLTRYRQRYDFPNTVPPKLILADIKLFYDHVDWSNYSDSVNPKTNIPYELTLPFNKNHFTFNFRALTVDNATYKFILENLDDTWSPYSVNNQAVYTNIPPGTYTFRVIAKNSFGIESKESIAFTFTVTPPFWKTWWFYTISSVVVLAGLFLFFRWRTANLEKEKRILEQRVNERTAELKTANEHLSVALHDIKDSINYAERIQRAIMPVQDKIRESLPDSFILFRPRDVVSGDFYWYNHKDGTDYIAAVDCTGHGVPGAFMSMVGSSLLNEIVLTKGISDPSQILTQLNSGVQNALKQKENQTRDGMDLAFCAIDYKARKLFYAGANRSLWIIRNSQDKNEVEEIKATKCAIGGFTNESQVYDRHEVQLQPGDTVYMHSDGFADQFGGPQGKKLMTKRFKDILVTIQKFGMYQQATELGKEIDQWMGHEYEQVDDILVIGVRF